jgi:hypothetical protein
MPIFAGTWMIQIFALYVMLRKTSGDSLLNCNISRSVWALFDEELTEHLISNHSDDAKLWLFWLSWWFDMLNQDDLARVLVMLWAI